MNAVISIPETTRQRLANPAAPGGRHMEIVKTASALVAAGLNGEAVFCQIRPSYAPDVSDTEIRSVIRWAEKRFTAAVSIKPQQANRVFWAEEHTGSKRRNRAEEAPELAIRRFLGGFLCDEADLWEASPYRLFGTVESDAISLLTALYGAAESINIVAEYAKSGEKARPIGYGTTLKRDEWLAHFSENGPPKSAAGVWIRPNPTDGKGISDVNVAIFRFALLEFDSIPLPLQLAFFARLPLPIAAVITSGGKSLHAWVRIDAENADAYRETVSHLFRILKPFGIDPSNRNPARLSRLPGVSRQMGGIGDKRQRLLYLNPNPDYRRIFE